VPFDVCSALPLLRASHLQSVSGADPGICVRGSRTPPLSFLLEAGSPLNQLDVCGERRKLPQRVRGGAPAENEFGAF